MTRLPQPGGDDGSWGSILNNFLTQSHNTDGTLKNGVVTAAQLAPNAVTGTALNISGGTDGQVLTKDSTKTGGFSWAAAGTTSDATATTKGVVQLAGDLGGTAAAPTVPGLAAKYTKPGSGIPASDLAASVQTSLTAASSAVQTVNSKTGTNITLTAGDVGAATSLSGLSDVSSAGATDGQSLVFNSGTWGPATVAAGSPSVTDATTTTKGVVQLAGDLGGNAAAPTVPGLASKVNTSVVGQANGVASLDGTGKVPSAQLPASAAQVNSDWNATSGVAQILNKPTLSTVATTGSYSDLTNKPTIPTVSDATSTAKGVVQLAGDLGGTAAAPTVPGLAAKYTKPAGGIPSTDLTTSVQTSLTAAGSAVQTVNSKSGTNITLTASDVGAATALSGLSDVTLTSINNSDVLTYNTTAAKWENAPAVDGRFSFTSPADGDVAQYDSTSGEFVNSPLDFSSIAGTAALAQLTSGAIFRILWDVTVNGGAGGWTYAGAYITTRPTSRTDVYMEAVDFTGGSGGTPPGFGIVGDTYEVKTS